MKGLKKSSTKSLTIVKFLCWNPLEKNMNTSISNCTMFATYIFNHTLLDSSVIAWLLSKDKWASARNLKKIGIDELLSKGWFGCEKKGRRDKLVIECEKREKKMKNRVYLMYWSDKRKKRAIK
jgi:hypothetical protein